MSEKPFMSRRWTVVVSTIIFIIALQLNKVPEDRHAAPIPIPIPTSTSTSNTHEDSMKFSVSSMDFLRWIMIIMGYVFSVPIAAMQSVWYIMVSGPLRMAMDAIDSMLPVVFFFGVAIGCGIFIGGSGRILTELITAVFIEPKHPSHSAGRQTVTNEDPFTTLLDGINGEYSNYSRSKASSFSSTDSIFQYNHRLSSVH
ncbi:hypothetical protein BDB01DRAFT_779672 [Pilobolus umbonatus]|nr:hypothetical protein BDB01DRAFT_779672 [Pilobolus umbonatus]